MQSKSISQGNQFLEKHKMLSIMLGAFILSTIIATTYLVLMSFGTGSWLDPRVWSGSYVKGTNISSSLQNYILMQEFVNHSVKYVFSLVFLVSLVGGFTLTYKNNQ